MTSLRPVPSPGFSADWFSCNIPVWRQALAPFAGRCDVHYLEVGLFEGRSALWMLQNVLTHATSRLTAIDKDDTSRALANFQSAGVAAKATIIKGRSGVELRKLPLDRFDIIYLDGSHEAKDVLSDAVLSWDLLKIGGILILDDYLYEPHLPENLRPEAGIDSFLNLFRRELEEVYCGYQIIARKITPEEKSSGPRQFENRGWPRRTDEEILAILEEERTLTLTDICRSHGISETTFRHWAARYDHSRRERT